MTKTTRYSVILRISGAQLGNAVFKTTNDDNKQNELFFSAGYTGRYVQERVKSEKRTRYIRPIIKKSITCSIGVVVKDSDRLTYHLNGNCVNYILKGFLITGNLTPKESWMMNFRCR